MKSVIKSVSPRICEKVANGGCTLLVSKTAPKQVPFKCYIYCTFPKKPAYTLWLNRGTENKFLADGKVIGEFICDKVERFSVGSLRSDDIQKLACLSYYEMICYFYKPEELDGKTAKQGFAWHISDLKIYDKPKELSEFYYCCKEMKANEPRAGKYVSLSCYACRHNALKRTEDYSEYNNMLGYICKRNITRPPSNWCYVEEL